MISFTDIWRMPFVAAFALFVSAHIPTASAQNRYVVLDMGAVHEGSESGGLDVNVRNEVVGAVISADGNHHAFVYARGELTDLGTLPEGSSSVASAVNALGHIVGTSSIRGGYSHAFLYADGEMRDLGTVGGSGSGALAINDRDEAAGFSSLAGDQEFEP